MTKKRLILVISVVVCACVLAGTSLYANNRLPWFRGELPNCLRLRVGTGVLEVRYPDTFIDVSYERAIRLMRGDPKHPGEGGVDEGYVLTIDPVYSFIFVDYVSGTEPGPKMSTSTFNGYEVAYLHSDYKNAEGIWDYYAIPAGNFTGFDVGYHYSLLSGDEKLLGDKMLHSIKINTGTEEVKQARVEECW